MSTSYMNSSLISTSSLKRPSSPSTIHQPDKRQNRSATPSGNTEAIIASASDSEEEDVKPRKKLEKGKGRAKELPELPGEVWRHIFQIFNQTWQDAWDDGASLTPATRSALTPLLISKELTAITLPLLYNHPHLSFTTIPLFLQSINHPSRYAKHPKQAYVSSLTIKPSPHIPGTHSHPKGSALMPTSNLTGTPYTIHPQFEAVLRQFPELYSFTLKDTLILHRADAKRLFDGLRQIKPRKARLEIRMWNLYESPVGEDILAVSRPTVYSTMLPPPPFDTSVIDGLGTRPQYTWRDALHQGYEWELPAGWSDSIYSSAAQAPPPALPPSTLPPLALALGSTTLASHPSILPAPSGASSSSAPATSSSTGTNLGRRNTSGRERRVPYSSVFSRRARRRDAISELLEDDESDIEEITRDSSETERHTPAYARFLHQQAANSAPGAAPALGSSSNAIDFTESSDDEADDLSPEQLSAFQFNASSSSSSPNLTTSLGAVTDALDAARAAAEAHQRVSEARRTRIREAWISKHGQLGGRLSPSAFWIPQDRNSTASSGTSAQPPGPRSPTTTIFTSRRVDSASTPSGSSSTVIPPPSPVGGWMVAPSGTSSNNLSPTRETRRRSVSSRDNNSHSSSRTGPPPTRSLDNAFSLASSQGINTRRTQTSSVLAHVNPGMEGFYTTESGLTAAPLAHDIRYLLRDLVTDHWEGRLFALSLVALDPLASVVFRAPMLDLWTSLAVPHIRVHLPRGIHSLAVLKGAKETADDHARVRRDPNEPPTPPHRVRIVGGDGQGGNLLHSDIRLFEIEVNTIAEMTDDQWIEYGYQIPPQVCRILIGDQDWRAVRVGIDRFASTPAPIDVTPDRSPLTSNFNSPTFSFNSLDSDDEEEQLARDGEESEGDTYDSEAAEAQARMIAERKAKKAE